MNLNELIWYSLAVAVGFILRDAMPAFRYLVRLLFDEARAALHRRRARINLARWDAIEVPDPPECECERAGMPQSMCCLPGHSPLGREQHGEVVIRWLDGGARAAVLQCSHAGQHYFILCLARRGHWIGEAHARKTEAEAMQDWMARRHGKSLAGLN